MSEASTKCNNCNTEILVGDLSSKLIEIGLCFDCSMDSELVNHTLQSTKKWFTERGSVWRTLENKRLKMEKNGHITEPIRGCIVTEKEEREFYFIHQLPRGNPNLLPGLPKEYVK